MALVTGGPPRAPGLPLLRVGEDEVDIGREVELPGPQLAHPQHHQGLGLTGGAVRSAQFGVQPALQQLQARGDAGVGQARELRRGLRQIRPSGQIAPGDAHHLALPEAPQPGHQGGLVGHPGQGALQALGMAPGRVRMMQIPAAVQIDKHPGVTDAAARHELAAEPDQRQRPEQLVRQGGIIRIAQRLPVAVPVLLHRRPGFRGQLLDGLHSGFTGWCRGIRWCGRSPRLSVPGRSRAPRCGRRSAPGSS